MKKYVFCSSKKARKFVFEVIAKKEIWNFDFRENYVRIFDDIPNEVERKAILYGAKEEKCR